MNNPVIVLLYHRVVDLSTDPQLLAISKINFEAQMKYLKDRYNVLRFDEPWTDIKEPSVVITFDDGYADNYYNAWPILEKYNIPATIFVSSGNIDTNREFWWDNLERLILLNNDLPKVLRLDVDNQHYDFILTNRNLIEKCYMNLHPILKKVGAAERERVLDMLNEVLKPHIPFRDNYRTMNSKELNKIAQSKIITIGGHTVTHTQLSTQSEIEQEYEIKTSKKMIEKIIGKKITTFSYPFGGRIDYNPSSIRIVKNYEYRKAASNFPGQFHQGDNEIEIPRNIVRNWEITQFVKLLKRFRYL